MNPKKYAISIKIYFFQLLKKTATTATLINKELIYKKIKCCSNCNKTATTATPF